MATLAANALTTVADVKESLGIASGDNTKNNLITRKINYVSSLIEKYCDRSFVEAQYIEYVDASNDDTMVLAQRPIVQDGSHAFSIERRDTSLNEESFETVATDLYFIDNASGTIELEFNAVGRWNRYRVTYYAGYATTPDDLAEAANLLVCYFVRNPDGSDVGIMMRSEGQKQVRYQKTATTFKTIMQNLGVDQVLDAYANSPVLTNG